MINNYTKSRISLYYFMLGRQYYTACQAMVFAEKLHNGLRKDHITPEFAHQIWIANFIRTLHLDEDVLETALAVSFLHDTAEDKAISCQTMSDKFSATIGDGVDRMTKKFKNVKVDPEVYFERLSESAIAALVKGVDRLHNISSMVGVFSIEKQKQYIEETEQRHIPMLKKARKTFPKYEDAYENIKQNLLDRIKLIKAIHQEHEKHLYTINQKQNQTYDCAV